MSGNEEKLRGLDAAQVEALINSHFPQIHVGGRAMLIEAAGARRARVRLKKQDRHLRPGGTVSGPTMFMLADFSVYVAIIATLGEAGIDAVTTNLNINFLAKPEPRDLIACVRVLRLGRRLAVGEAQLFSDRGADRWRTRWPPMPCRVRPGPLEVIFYRQPRHMISLSEFRRPGTNGR